MRPGKIAGGPIANNADGGGRNHTFDCPCDVFTNDTSYYKLVWVVIGLRYAYYSNINPGFLHNPGFYQTRYCRDYIAGRMFITGLGRLSDTSIRGHILRSCHFHRDIVYCLVDKT